MANFNFLPDRDLYKIADKLGTWMPKMDSWTSCQTSESTEMFTIDAADLLSDKTADECLQKMNCWQVQVLVSGKPSLVVRVGRSGDSWQVYSMYGEEFAIAMDKALSWIDANVHDEYNVKMFQIPAYYVSGLLFEKGDDVHVYIVKAAAGMPIQVSRVYTFDEMRKILATRLPINGVKD
jgi:hypothetical protein